MQAGAGELVPPPAQAVDLPALERLPAIWSDYAGRMPLVEVTYSPVVSEQTLTKLAAALAHAVSVAVQCPEEPYDGDLQPGDVEIRFRQLGPFDRSGLDVVIEVRSKWFESRARDRQQRVEQLHRDLAAAAGLENFGIYLTLPVAAWAQSE